QINDWLPFRDDFLDELLRYEGCEQPIESGEVLCEACNSMTANARCRDCRRRPLHCIQCLLQMHTDLPLHRPETWNGSRFVHTTLCDLGLTVQLGHSRGTCKHPSSTTRRIVIVDMCGIQPVCVRFCECLDEQNDLTREWAQLFREGWFPASTTRPETAITFQLLKSFQEINFAAKTNLYDFCQALERLTDNTGSRDVPMSHVTWLWRHLVALKRFGCAHDPSRAAGTQEGQLALECPACPHPGKNIPENWRNAPADVRWLYTLFLMMDANFRARCKDRGFEETQLAPGWAYFVEETKYQAHLEARANDRSEENTCSVEHNAILKASIRREGYIASGVGAVLCARHALVRRNGTGDLQLGERYPMLCANMDYLAFRTLVGAALLLMISYDIVCQWTRHLWERMKNWPLPIQIDESRITDFRFSIPKEHIRVHGPGHSKYSFNLLPHVGRTYGEGIESHWSYMNPLALSTREMSLGMRHELMNDHWGSWNWRKVIGFGPALLRSLEEAHAFRIEQARVFREYSATFDPNVVRTWEDMVSAWNADQSRPDPYEEPKKTSTTAAIKHEIALEEAADAVGGKLPPHEVTPGVFLQVGLELEEQQRAVRLRGSNGTSLSSLAEQQEKRNVLLRRIELWQEIQDVHMPMVAPLRVAGASTNTPPASSSAPIPQEIPLLLPSSLPPTYRSTDALAALLDKERRLRMAQMTDALEDIRHLRRVLTGISEYMRFNVDGEGQRVTTRFRDLYSRFHAKVKRAAERYRTARAAVSVLDPQGSWVETFKPLLDPDIRGPRREDDSITASDGRYEVSWIWLVPSAAPKSTSANHAAPASAEEFTASMRVEWAHAKARAERWKEEERLLLEEMRRVVKYCEWKAAWWRSQGVQRDGHVPVCVQRGLRAYAAKQADVWGGLARRSASWWVEYLRTLGPLPDWILPYEE
ncbi:hypothetical protein GY45DRAFT_1234598, partial [Cubamyces sp. BRFM 1775]